MATERLAPEQEAPQVILQLATGYIASAALWVAVRLRIADRLATGPQSAAELAVQTGANEDALYRVLRLLASLGVFREVSPRRFAHTPPSETLRSDSPGSTHPMSLWLPDPFHFRVYADTLHSVMTGQPAVEKAVGMPVFDYLAKDRELGAVFHDAMTAFSAFVVPAALEVYDFSGIGVLVDVAGGHGQLLTSILEKYPAMRGVLSDLDHVIAGAEPRIRASGLADRCQTVAIDFFKAVPRGGDAYIMKHIIHDWDDERATVILENIKKAMNPGARVILLESVLMRDGSPDFGTLIDLEMLLMPGGRERTEDEFRALFARAGFRLTRILATRSPLSVIEAVAS